MSQIALLRGINVGGRNKLPMKTLIMLIEALGGKNVRTYIQSGNVVYDGQLSAADITAAIKEHVGFAPRVFVISAEAFRKAVGANPFGKEAAASGKTVHLFLLDGDPAPADLDALLNLKRPTEDFALVGQALYLHTPNGLSSSAVAEKIDRILKVETTARNWNTVTKLLEMTT
ncbi:MAG: DUF1697 domain-containing protein [Pseudomonadota bacterium]